MRPARSRRRWQRRAGSCLLVAPLLAPQAELFLGDPIGEAEQNQLLVGNEAMRHPARDGEDVARLAADGALGASLADKGTAAAFDRGDDGVLRGAVGPRLEAPRQELQEGRDRRHRAAAGGWIDVGELEAGERVPFLRLAQFLER